MRSPAYLYSFTALLFVVLYCYYLKVAQIVIHSCFRPLSIAILVKNGDFDRFQLVCDGPTDRPTNGPTDRWTDRPTCMRLYDPLCPSVGRSVRRSVTLSFFGVTGGFCITAPAQMLGLLFFITAPAHPHPTSAAVYPPLFLLPMLLFLLC